jgi:CRISPR-associated protein Csb1
MNNIDLNILQSAVAGAAAAFRARTRLQPAGGEGDKAFPPTYAGAVYATEERRVKQPDGGYATIPCVLMDSVQSQANRMEQALLDAHRDGLIDLPLVTTRFDQPGLKKQFTVTSLDAPHRVADALFRDSLLDGVMFRQSEKGRILNYADVRNATGLFGLNPAALVFGLWDSTGPRGGLGAKFQRALVSEMVGLDAVAGVTVASRIDAAQISSHVTIYKADNELGFTPFEDKAVKDSKGKPVLFNRRGGSGDPGKPSKANHSNVTPDLVYRKANNSVVRDRDGNPIPIGGVTVSSVLQTTVLSLTCLRRLRFPLDGSPDSKPQIDLAGRTTLAALGLAAATLAHEQMTDLRSRCQLFPKSNASWQLLDDPGEPAKDFTLSPQGAIELLRDAITAARESGLPWEKEIQLTPSEELIELVRRSQEIDAAEGEGAE